MGAGRTEVARAIVGVDKITAGGLLRSGRPVRIPDPAAAARLGVGYLSEDRKRYGLLLESSVTANIDIGSLPRMSRLGWVRDKLAAAAAADWVERLRVRTPSVRQIVRNLAWRKPDAPWEVAAAAEPSASNMTMTSPVAAATANA